MQRISRRRLTGALGAALCSASLPARAQQQPKVWRIGFLAARSRSTPAKPDIWYDAFVQGLRELGYAEGKNLIIEWRFADGQYERFPVLAAELMRLKPDVLVTHTTLSTFALQRETKTIPIVVTGINDAINQGFSTSLARPSGNVTGLINFSSELIQKRLEQLTILIPKLSKVAMLQNPGGVSNALSLKSLTVATDRLGIKLVPVDARTAEEIERGFAQMARERIRAVIVANDAFFLGQGKLIAELAVKHRIASISPYSESVKEGVLMSYGQDTVEAYRHLAVYVVKILKGAKVSDLPIEQPTKIQLAINLKTAKALGLKFPEQLLLRADEVIE